MANGVDPDQTPRFAASDLGLHCLLRHVCPNTYGNYSSPCACACWSDTSLFAYALLRFIFEFILCNSLLTPHPSYFSMSGSVYTETIIEALTSKFIRWIATWENVTSDMCAQRRLKSACASGCLISLRCPHEDTLVLSYQWRVWEDCGHAQADVNLRWTQLSEGTFSDIAIQIVLLVLVVSVL